MAVAENVDTIANVFSLHTVYRQELLLYSCHLTVLGLMLTRVQAPHYSELWILQFSHFSFH